MLSSRGGRSLMDKADEYRRLAANCVSMAERVTDHQFKASLVDMAGAWLRLAEQAEKNSRTDLVYETPPRPSAQVVQQQQQQQQQQQPEPKSDE
jgi:hypothetical protein